MKNRKPNRLSKYDYSLEGVYFITICVQNHECAFGKIENGNLILNTYGIIVEKQWHWLFRQYPYIKTGEFVIMPNHFHGIIIIVGNGRDRSLQNNDRSLQKWQKIKPLPELIGAFKTTSSKFIRMDGLPNFKWQKSFHDRIIRNPEEFHRIENYIRNNPANWNEDRDNWDFINKESA